jgi:hypothetical protein
MSQDCHIWSFQTNSIAHLDAARSERNRAHSTTGLIDLRRIRAARYDVFLTMNDLENASGFDFENALRDMDKISRYEKRALSKRKRALRSDFTSEEK